MRQETHMPLLPVRPTRTLCVLIAASVVACGGGGDGRDESAGVVADAPAVAVPNPAPVAPAALPGPIGLTQLTEFPTLGFSYRYMSNSAGSQLEGPVAPEQTETISFSYRSTDQSYGIGIPGLEPARLGPLYYQNEYGSVHGLIPSPSPNFELLLRRPSTANGGHRLDYTSYGEWEDPIYDANPAGRRSNNTGCFAYGVPTQAGGVPLAGRKAYTAEVTGRTSASLGVWYVFGSASFVFDFAAGTLTGYLGLGINPGGPGHQAFGTFDFAATRFVVGETHFSGRFRLPDGSEDGHFEGRFNGPQASELMVRWVLPQRAESGSLFGVAVGSSP
jgi:hypothetical protein